MGVTTAVRTAPSRLRVRLSWANLVANIGIVLTGGAVRLTGSGLGCPTWPRCTDDSYVVHDELGLHGAIEFGNRMLTFVLVVVAIACWVAALVPVVRDWAGADRRPLVLATVIALGIPAQAVIGGITVHTDLNPWVVALHLLASLAIISACVLLLDRLVGQPRSWALPWTRRAALATFAVGWVVLYLGTVVTGSGPQATRTRVGRGSTREACPTCTRGPSTRSSRSRSRPSSWPAATATFHCGQRHSCCWPSRRGRGSSATRSTSWTCRSRWS
jgi:heme a synthase